MVASNYYQEHNDALIDREVPSLSNMRFLPCMALYGANASGKTTVLQAIVTLREMVIDSFSRTQSNRLNYTPFKLDDISENLPTVFELVFVADGVRYEYNLQYMQTRVIYETLTAYPKSKKQTWFMRQYNDDYGMTTCDVNKSYLKIPKEIDELLADDTLFLSLLMRLNNTGINSITKWFMNHLIFVNILLRNELNSDGGYSLSARILENRISGDQTGNKLLEILQKADFGITQAEAVRKVFKANDSELALENNYSTTIKDIINRLNIEQTDILFTHQGNSISRQFHFNEESAGTQRLFKTAGIILDALENGKTLVIDELDTSLHPLLVQEIVKLFQSNETNKTGAQLIFAVHDVSILDEGILRRDQVWFTKKSSDGSTVLYPLSDFQSRKSEKIADGYLVGRYGAIPSIPELFDLPELDRPAEALATQNHS